MGKTHLGKVSVGSRVCARQMMEGCDSIEFPGGDEHFSVGVEEDSGDAAVRQWRPEHYLDRPQSSSTLAGTRLAVSVAV